MIINPGIFLIAGLGGFLVGLMYFAWLWRSVSALASARRPAAGLVLNAILRITALATVVGLILWLEIAPSLLLVAGLAFFMARLLMTAILGRVESGE